MEDRHVARLDLLAAADAGPHLLQCNFFAVFDGHSGFDCAEVAAQQLPDLLSRQPQLTRNPCQALNGAFARLDQVLAAQPCRSGTTALALLQVGQRMVLANCGDSRAVLSNHGRAKPLTTDHKPCSPSEHARIAAAGAGVCGSREAGSYLCPAPGTPAADHEGCGEQDHHIAVTRALGDFHLHKLKFRTADSQGPLISEPEIHEYKMDSQDEFIILACDGLWDVMTSARAVESVRLSLRRHNDPDRAAKELVDMAVVQLHSSDNVTALVVCFGEQPPPARFTRENSQLASTLALASGEGGSRTASPSHGASSSGSPAG